MFEKWGFIVELLQIVWCVWREMIIEEKSGALNNDYTELPLHFCLNNNYSFFQIFRVLINNYTDLNRVE